jgi:hypothetical protein
MNINARIAHYSRRLALALLVSSRVMSGSEQ